MRKRVLPPDLFPRAFQNQDIFLTIPDEIMKSYAVEKSIPLNVFSHLQRRQVACVSDAYGRVGIFLTPMDRLPPPYDSRTIVLDLIERAVGLAPRSRNDAHYHAEYSNFAKCCDSLTVFNDGLLYVLGDHYLEEHPMAGAKRYSIAFGFARTKGRIYRALPAGEKELDFWKTFVHYHSKFGS